MNDGPMNVFLIVGFVLAWLGVATGALARLAIAAPKRTHPAPVVREKISAWGQVSRIKNPAKEKISAWGQVSRIKNPANGINHPFADTTPLGLLDIFGRFSQGSSFVATLG